MNTKVKIKNISIKLPEDIHRKLKAKCAMDGESTGNVLKRLIDEYIKGLLMLGVKSIKE